MRLPTVLAEIERRTPAEPSLWVNPSERVGFVLGNRDCRTGSGIPYEYDSVEVEELVVWTRMDRLFGRSSSGIRRAAQDAVPGRHAPGWVVMSGGKAWFQPDPPADLILSGQGAAAVRVHDDCRCEVA